MPFLPFAATVGAMVGATGAGAATVGGLVIAGTAAAVAGVGVSISSSIAQSNAAEKQTQEQQDLLNQQAKAKTDAATTAQQAVTDRRRSILATGGETDITGGTATLGSGSGARKTILGA
jgi:hypothetical protein